MRANLPTMEPRVLGEWEALNLYGRLRRRRAGAPRFLLHDGPPYANGELHMGHALNKSLKDIIIRFKALSGFDTPFVPGWDCHGLPIEHNVGKSLGRKAEELSQVEIRAKCRDYAARFVGIQREGFKRLGCIGLWENPYLTMDPLFEARIIEAFHEIHARGFV
jgi:isoleucyl-tRNA synthetase